MKINKITTEDKVLIYKLTRSPKMGKMSEIPDGTVLKVVHFAFYTDTNNEGKEQEILSIMTDNGDLYGTNSSTFQREFSEIEDIFEGSDIPPITIVHGKTKAGRDFITCALS